MRELRVVRADPAGNITLFVLTPVEKAECAAVAAKLLAIEALKAEQVGFIFPNGHMEMEAGEFCGNASRAYGYLLAKQQGLKGRHTMRLSVSGCDHPVAVTVDMDAGTASAEMPLPKLVEQVEVAGTAGTPLVKVPEAGTLVFEGSCGSGTLASAIALSRGCDGDFSVALRQPAGTVYASVTRQAGAVTAASIGGSVALEAPITVAI